jgi:hypothetical protein
LTAIKLIGNNGQTPRAVDARDKTLRPNTDGTAGHRNGINKIDSLGRAYYFFKRHIADRARRVAFSEADSSAHREHDATGLSLGITEKNSK